MSKLNEDDFYEMTKEFLVETARGEKQFVRQRQNQWTDVKQARSEWNAIREKLGLDASIESPWKALHEGLLTASGFEAVMDQLDPGWRLK